MNLINDIKRWFLRGLLTIPEAMGLLIKNSWVLTKDQFIETSHWLHQKKGE